MITPAGDALHLPQQRDPGMPVVAVLVIVLAKFAVPRAICLHHVAMLQACRSPLFLWALLTAVRGITSHRVTAGQHWTCHLLTVHLTCRSLASADSTFNVAKGRYKGMPCGPWSVHLLVSFKVATFRMFFHPLWSFHVSGIIPIITDTAALAIKLNGSGAGQHWTNDWITYHCSLLAAAGETLVVAGRPAGAMSMVLVLKEAGMGVFLQFFWVFHKEVIKLSLLHLPPSPKITVVWHVDPPTYFS